MDCKSYYFPIDSKTLVHYFGCACLVPSKYLQNKPKDIQDKFDAFLLFTESVGIEQSDCCLEVVFTDEEGKDLVDIHNGWFLFEKPLPITRVKKIFFADEEQMKRTVTNIRMSTAFVPDSLIGGIRHFEHTQTDDLRMPEDCSIPDNSALIKKYDRFLGAIALMRIAREDYMNYSVSYASTLATFNSIIKQQLIEQNQPSCNKLSGLFTQSNEYANLIPLLDKSITEEDLRNVANREKQDIKKNNITRIIDLSSLKGNSYIVALLFSYGVGGESKRKKIDSLIISHFKDSDIKCGKAEGLALCYGYNRGYSVFNNEYGISATNKEWVKFRLESLLDYYTIESIYQYVFNHVEVSGTFPYLDSWCPKQPFESPKRKRDFKILDTVFYGKKKAKVFSSDYWKAFFQSFHFGPFQKVFEDLFRQIGDVLYSDIKEEISEEYEDNIEAIQKQQASLMSDKDSEIENLRKECSVKDERIAKLEKILTTNPVEFVCEPSLPASESNGENEANWNTNYNEIESIIRTFLTYNKKKTSELKEELKSHGLNPKGLNKEEMIIRIMTSSKSYLYNE